MPSQVSGTGLLNGCPDSSSYRHSFTFLFHHLLGAFFIFSMQVPKKMKHTKTINFD